MMAALSRTTRKRALSLAKETTSTANGMATRTVRSKISVTTVTTTTTATTGTTAAPSLAQRPKLVGPAHIRCTPWISVTIPISELDLSTTLKCGQSFRWHREHRELESGQISLPTYSCVLDHRLWCIQETEDGFKYRTFRPSSSPSPPGKVGGVQEHDEVEKEQDKDFLRDYFQLDVPLTQLYAKWSDTDANFKAKAPLFPGVRILRQDPVENLICFICSSNNNISRISQMASKLCQEYGFPMTIPPQAPGEASRTFYGFPTMDALAQEGVEETLRKLGFGYRAKYIANTAKMIDAMDNGEEWLMGLRKLPYEEAHTALLTLQGVGPKVADCVCLMSLDKHESIPVDTHVWQIAVRDYKFRFEGKVPKTISPAIYKAVGKHFVDLFGDYSGWAHSVLFAADLRSIEGRVKKEGDQDDTNSGLVIKVKEELVETTVLSTAVKQEDPEDKRETRTLGVSLKQEAVEEESNAVSQGMRGIKLEDSVIRGSGSSSTESGIRRQSKRRRGA